LLKTPFHSWHASQGAKFVDFAGWEMPISYGSIIAEHNQVRTAGGMFDVSHMGRIKISGRHARRLVDKISTRKIQDMVEKQVRYSLVCNPQGGVMDDILIYRFADYWYLVVNASNREKIVAHLKAQAEGLVVKIDDETMSTAMVAIQGPGVIDYIGRLSKEIPTLKRYSFAIKNVLVMKLVVSRTGYTGEDGVEVILPASVASMALKLLIKDKAAVLPPGEVNVTIPVGLGARDTLRMEASMPLYGHELGEEINPFSAGLGWAVSLDKDQDENGEKFVGQDALKAIHAAGVTRKLIGLKLDGKRTARQGMNVLKGETVVGQVTSGCLSPTLGYPIAMAMVDAQAIGEGDAARVDLGSAQAEGVVVPMPFYKRAKK
jgi:aminomethyltransferase